MVLFRHIHNIEYKIHFTMYTSFVIILKFSKIENVMRYLFLYSPAPNVCKQKPGKNKQNSICINICIDI